MKVFLPAFSLSMLQSFYQKGVLEAGIDEAGRGCLAGPVFAAAVILPADFYHPLLNDSKQVSEKKRELLRPIIEKEAIAWTVAQVGQEEIDRINILNANFKAMHDAVTGLKVLPQLLLVDGNRFLPYPAINHVCLVKGDAHYASIAAASILAKTHRDDYMTELHTRFPQYDWLRNKGYGTAKHVAAILKHGYCEHHRRSFKLNTQGKLF